MACGDFIVVEGNQALIDSTGVLDAFAKSLFGRRCEKCWSSSDNRMVIYIEHNTHSESNLFILNYDNNLPRQIFTAEIGPYFSQIIELCLE